MVLSGHIEHHEAGIIEKGIQDYDAWIPLFKYKSPLNGGNGLSLESNKRVKLRSYALPPLSEIEIPVDKFHTMSCDKGSMWIVSEGGFERDHSFVLGRPFITDGLYTQPKQFQINDMHQKVLAAVKKIVMDIELTEEGKGE